MPPGVKRIFCFQVDSALKGSNLAFLNTAKEIAMSDSAGSLSSHLWDTSDLYRNSVMQLREAADTMKLDPNIAERLKVPKRALIVSVPIRLDDGSSKFLKATASSTT